MKIPRNFDRWMFDYKEGNLSQSEISYFENYMSENPQFNADIDAWDKAFIEKENVLYPNVDKLTKNNRFFAYWGWVASFVILLSAIGGGFYFTKNNTIYSLRDNKFNLQNNYTNKVINNKLFSFNKQNKSANNNLINSNQQLQHLNNKHTSFNNLQHTKSDLIEKNSINNIYTNKLNNSVQISNSKSKNNRLLIKDELNKINSDKNKYNASYKQNPKFKTNLRVTSTKRKNRYGLLSYKIQKIFRSLEKMTGSPVRLTNLKDPDFFTPQSNLMNINSAFAGGYGTPRFETRYRNQWFGNDNNLQTSYLNFDTYSQSLRGGLGVVLCRQDFNNGTYVDENISLFYSPKFAINNKVYFEPAIKMSLGLMTMDNSSIQSNKTYEIEKGIFANPSSQTDLPQANNLWYKDYGLGFIINADKFYLGFNADNLSRHNESIYGLNRVASIKYNIIAGIDYQSKNKKMTLSPFINFTKNSSINELWAGTNIKYNWLTIGGAYSTLNEFSSSLGVKFKTFKLIYQYDRTKSLSLDDKIGSHTLSIRVNAKRKQIR